MAFDINQFSGEMAKNGIAKTSDFEVELTGAPVSVGSGSLSIANILDGLISTAANAVGLGGLVGGANGVAQSLSFRIETIQMPGRSINNIDYIDYGAPYKVGGKTNYTNTLVFTAICSPSLIEREFFMAWQDLIGGDHRTGTSNFDLGFYDEYICKRGFEIFQLDPNGNRTRVIKLIDSYPVNIGEISYSWATTDVVRLPVTMSYRYFEEEEVPVPPFNFTLENVLSAANTVRNLPAQVKGRSRAALDRAGVPRF